MNFYNLFLFLVVRSMLFTFQVFSLIYCGSCTKTSVHPYVCALILSGRRPLLHLAFESKFVKCTEYSIIAQAMGSTALLTDWGHMILSCREGFW